MRPLTAALAWLMLASVGCPAPARFPAPDLQVSTDEATVARGEYLAQHVAICIECHSQRQWEYYGGPAAVGTEGQGGTSFVEIYKVPSDVVMPAPNITPTALGHWSDGEVFRAITGGLDDEGEALFPSMPFNQYRDMAQPDLEAIVAYLRTLPPLPVVQPERDLKYRVLQDITNTFPMKPVIRDTAPQLGDRGYGAYIARIASCRWCHTPSDAGGWPIAGSGLLRRDGLHSPAARRRDGVRPKHHPGTSPPASADGPKRCSSLGFAARPRTQSAPITWPPERSTRSWPGPRTAG